MLEKQNSTKDLPSRVIIKRCNTSLLIPHIWKTSNATTETKCVHKEAESN